MDPWMILPSGRSMFTVVIAPREVLAAFLRHRMETGGNTSVLFICRTGSTPPPCEDLAVQVAGTLEEYLQALRTARTSLICVEYDPAACGPQGEHADELAETLRRAARCSEVVLLATARDPVLDSIAGKAERVICTNIGQDRTRQPRTVRGRQTTFREALWGEASEA
ncbi:MAG: hypothetical protein LUQ40_02880 [Methanomicrobiales archaeon]|nr:hypothetical protein [Methanomicrobiales archaeon]